MKSEEKTGPAWKEIAGWGSATAALAFVVVGAVFLQPSGDRAIEVSQPFDAGLGLESLDDAPILGDPIAALDDEGVGEGVGVSDPAPANLSFVEEGEPPPLVEASPLENPDLAADGPDDAANASDAVGIVAIETEPPAASVSVTDAGGFVDPFDTVGPPWVALSGEWLGSGGRFVQQDTGGFDLIAQLEVDVPESYRLSVVMAPMSGALSAGVLIGQQAPGERAGAYLIDFADAGTFLRFGQYSDAEAGYVYIEGLGVPEGFDPAATHDIAIVVEPTDTTVLLDGEFFATFGPASSGRVGLVTNGAATAFDDFAIEPA